MSIWLLAAKMAKAVPASQQGSAVVNVLVWGALAIVLTLAAGVVVLFLRRMLKRPLAPSEPALSAETIRELYNNGEISDAEYNALKRAALGLNKKSPRPLTPRGKDDDGKTESQDH